MLPNAIYVFAAFAALAVAAQGPDLNPLNHGLHMEEKRQDGLTALDVLRDALKAFPKHPKRPKKHTLSGPVTIMPVEPKTKKHSRRFGHITSQTQLVLTDPRTNVRGAADPLATTSQ